MKKGENKLTWVYIEKKRGENTTYIIYEIN